MVTIDINLLAAEVVKDVMQRCVCRCFILCRVGGSMFYLKIVGLDETSIYAM